MSILSPCTVDMSAIDLADNSMFTGKEENLPAELHADFIVIQRAFHEYEAGQDTTAQETLRAISLNSPYLEWKLFLRGLIAWVAKDSPRAIECWQRLNPGRLPAKLAAPLRLEIDPGQLDKIPARHKTWAQAVVAKVPVPGLLKNLKVVQSELVKKNSFLAISGYLNGIVTSLNAEHPDLVPGFARAIYFELARTGRPEDLRTYRVLFGNPTDDPDFQRLQAWICTALRQHSEAFRHWMAYEAWLGTKPGSWPERLLPRARATIWREMSRLAFENEDELKEPVFGFRQNPVIKSRGLLKPDGYDCLKKANAIEPLWFEPVRNLAKEYIEKNQHENAITVLEQYLKLNPGSIDALGLLKICYPLVGKYSLLVDTIRQLHQLKPLDNSIANELKGMASFYVLKVLQTEGPNAALALLESNPVYTSPDNVLILPIQLAINYATGQNADETAMWARIAAHPGAGGHILPYAFLLHVAGIVAKLKTKNKKLTESRFQAAMAEPVSAALLIKTLGILIHFEEFKVELKGEKALKNGLFCLLEQLPRPEDKSEELESLLALSLQIVPATKKHYEAFLDRCLEQDPNNPMFQYLNFKYAETLKTKIRFKACLQMMRVYKKLAANATEPRHKALEATFDNIIKQHLFPFFGFNPFEEF